MSKQIKNIINIYKDEDVDKYVNNTISKLKIVGKFDIAAIETNYIINLVKSTPNEHGVFTTETFEKLNKETYNYIYNYISNKNKLNDMRTQGNIFSVHDIEDIQQKIHMSKLYLENNLHTFKQSISFSSLMDLCMHSKFDINNIEHFCLAFGYAHASDDGFTDTHGRCLCYDFGDAEDGELPAYYESFNLDENENYIGCETIVCDYRSFEWNTKDNKEVA